MLHVERVTKRIVAERFTGERADAALLVVHLNAPPHRAGDRAILGQVLLVFLDQLLVPLAVGVDEFRSLLHLFPITRQVACNFHHAILRRCLVCAEKVIEKQMQLSLHREIAAFFWRALLRMCLRFLHALAEQELDLRIHAIEVRRRLPAEIVEAHNLGTGLAVFQTSAHGFPLESRSRRDGKEPRRGGAAHRCVLRAVRHAWREKVAEDREEILVQF